MNDLKTCKINAWVGALDINLLKVTISHIKCKIVVNIQLFDKQTKLIIKHCSGTGVCA